MDLSNFVCRDVYEYQVVSNLGLAGGPPWRQKIGSARPLRQALARRDGIGNNSRRPVRWDTDLTVVPLSLFVSMVVEGLFHGDRGLLLRARASDS